MGNLRDISRWGDRIITRKVVNLAAIANFASQSKNSAFLPIPTLMSMSFQLAESQSGAVVVFIVLVRVVVVL